MKRLANLALLVFFATPVAAQDGGDAYAAGKAEYMASCAACHGEAADGNGQIASMFREGVPGLTGLAAANEGTFPFLEVIQVIDGRTQVQAHGSPMPIFGARFRREIGDAAGEFGAEAIIRERVLELALYLNSIQQ